MYILGEREGFFIPNRVVDMERPSHNRQKSLVQGTVSRQKNLIQSIVSAGPNEWSYLLAVLGFALMLTSGLAQLLLCWWVFAQIGILGSAPSLQALVPVSNRLMLPHWVVILSALNIVSTLGVVSSLIALTAASHTRPTARLATFLGSVMLIYLFVAENLQHISLTRTEFALIHFSVALLWATGVFAIVLQTTEQQADGR